MSQRVRFSKQWIDLIQALKADKVDKVSSGYIDLDGKSGIRLYLDGVVKEQLLSYGQYFALPMNVQHSLIMDSKPLISLRTPINDYDASTKKYVDDKNTVPYVQLDTATQYSLTHDGGNYDLDISGQIPTSAHVVFGYLHIRSTSVPQYGTFKCKGNTNDDIRASTMVANQLTTHSFHCSVDSQQSITYSASHNDVDLFLLQLQGYM